MKQLPAGLQTILDSGASTMVHCWKVIRTDGIVQGFTEFDSDLVFAGITFSAASGFMASEVESSLGLAVDNLNVDGALSSDTINEEDLASGRYDNAEVELFWVNFEDTNQRIVLNKGNIGQVKRTEIAFSAELRSQAARLNQKTGRVYQKTCDAILGETRCGVSLAAFTSTATVTGISGRLVTLTITSNNTQDFYALGKAEFTSGENTGLFYEVKRHDVGTVTTIELWVNPTFPVLVGQTMNISAGCDKFHKTCNSKFANIINFQGFPYIPGNDVANSYVSSGSENDGGNLYVD